MATALSLKSLPGDFGEHFLPYKPSLRQRIQGRRFAKECYTDSVSIYQDSVNIISVKSQIFHSQRKTVAAHKTTITIDTDKSTITEAFCTCKAGYIQ